MPEETSRALLVALAREVAIDVADLQARGWDIATPTEGDGFRFRKVFTLPLSPDGISVRIKECRGAAQGCIQVLVEDKQMDLSDNREELLALVEDEGYDEILRIHRLLTERLN